MSVTIPDSHVDLLTGPVFVALVTIMPDGQPQVTPVWANYDGTYVKVNSARGRQKDQNIVANPKVAVLAIDPQNGYRWLEVRGDVVEFDEAEGVNHINELSALYTGNPDYYSMNTAANKDAETRVVYKIKPTKVNFAG